MSDIEPIPASWIVMAVDGHGNDYPIATRPTEAEAWAKAATEAADRRSIMGFPRTRWLVWVVPSEELVEVQPS